MDFTLTAGQVVLLDTPRGSRLSRIVGEVVSHEDGRVSIAVSEVDTRGLCEGLALASFPDSFGVVRAEVKVQLGDQPGALCLDIVQLHARQQRRSHVRARTQCRVAVVMAEAEFGSFQILHGVSIDLSRGGSKVQLTQAVPVGEIVNLTLELNGQKVVTLAKVLESNDHHETRFEFLCVPDEGVEHIVSRVMSAALSTPGARKLGRLGPESPSA